MKSGQIVIDFLKNKGLILVTAESCTAGQILSILGKIEGCGECLELGYVVYSEKAKKDVLHVRQETIETHTLTSEAVAREMALGALRKSTASAVISTTGITGPEPMDGIDPGTICFAWGFKKEQEWLLHSETKKFKGTRAEIQVTAAHFALQSLPEIYALLFETKQ
ncbi:CinA-like competence damage protein [Legionella birminghamensis]|uniref:CinA-like competence damage protein n=1 Tax=Legionella birminghamensis TaxID=28083 RepID=A0A378I8B9_9GAMM|nr:nicotinamide-nucleotide amidohydrolase family protein [Legionella birminghamensis]KTC68197.1 CinA-like competence damage protein [Legionella birminghamensis]STX31092.1 putative 17.2kDa protein, CinA-related competence damage protein [Legionella birminghamensis]